MRVLLDTHTLLWFDAGDERLSTVARRVLHDDNELIISAATIWEMAIKSSRKSLELPQPLGRYVDELTAAGYRLLPVSASHAAAIEDLPYHHRDPFDRMLVAFEKMQTPQVRATSRALRCSADSREPRAISRGL